MNEDVTLDFEIVVETLRSNIVAYGEASGAARRYRFYAFCRHEEARRRKLLALVDSATLPMPLPFIRKLGLRIRRIATGMRLRGSREHESLAELRHADIQLGELVNAVLDRCAELPYVHGWLIGLKDVLDDAEADMDSIEHSHRQTTHAVAA